MGSTKRKWVWLGNNTITQCRPTDGTSKKKTPQNRTPTATWQQTDNWASLGQKPVFGVSKNKPVSSATETPIKIRLHRREQHKQKAKDVCLSAPTCKLCMFSLLEVKNRQLIEVKFHTELPLNEAVLIWLYGPGYMTKIAVMNMFKNLLQS